METGTWETIDIEWTGAGDYFLTAGSDRSIPLGWCSYRDDVIAAVEEAVDAGGAGKSWDGWRAAQ